MDKLTAKNSKKALDLIKDSIKNPGDKTKKGKADKAVEYFDKLITMESSDEATQRSFKEDVCNDCLSFLSNAAVDA